MRLSEYISGCTWQILDEELIDKIDNAEVTINMMGYRIEYLSNFASKFCIKNANDADFVIIELRAGGMEIYWYNLETRNAIELSGEICSYEEMLDHLVKIL